MKTEFRNRAFLPVVLPLAIVGGALSLIVLFAVILLWNTRLAALMIALVAAAGILLAISLASSKDRLGAPQRAAVVGAAVLPVMVGAVFALGVGGVDESALNINREPHLVVPEDAPLIAAENAQTFCFPQEDGSCTPTDAWDIELASEDEAVVVFENLDEGIPHNVAFYVLEGDEPDTSDAGAIYKGEIFPGIETRAYTIEDGLPSGDVFFRCDVHPNMQGTATVTIGGGEA